MNEEIKETLYCDVYNDLDNEKYEKLLNYITNLQEENQKLVKVIEELEKWLKEKQNLTCGCGITAEYIYAYENVLDKLTELKGGNNDEV